MSDSSDDSVLSPPPGEGSIRTFGGDQSLDSRNRAWEDLAAATDDANNASTGEPTTKARTSQQEETDIDPETWPDWYDPPYQPEHLVELLERHETHAACVDIKSQAVAGYGFSIEPHKTAHDAGPGDDETERSDDEYHDLADFYFGPGSTFQLGIDRQRATAAEVFEQAWNDYESTGWLAIEVLTNPNTQEPTGLAHIPAHSIRKRQDAPGYVQVNEVNQIVAYFGAAGDKYEPIGGEETSGQDSRTFVDAETGDVADSSRGVDEVANELIVIRNYSGSAPHYGLPDIIPALQTVVGDIDARVYQAKLLENDNVPRMAVIVEGGELTERAWDELEEKFRNLSLDENQHRGILIESTSSVVSELEEDQGVNIRIEALTVGQQEDADFLEYRRENEHEIAKVHGVPPVMINRSEDVNRASAKAQRYNFAQTEAAPKQERLASRIHTLLHHQMMGVSDWTIDFNLRGGDMPQREADVSQTRIEGSMGAMTINEAREELGLPQLDGPVGEMLLATVMNNNAGGTGGGEGQSNPAMGTSVEAALQASGGNPYSITARQEDDD